MKKSIYSLLLTSCLIITATLTGYSQAGSLDLSFGTGGKVTTTVGSYDDFGTSVAIQSDGKIVVAGSSNNGIGLDFAIARYYDNGNLDNSFTGDGKVITNFGFSNSAGTCVAIQGDGKIVEAGYSEGGGTLIRYNKSGSLDTTFDFDGIVISNFGAANSIAIQGDGKIVVGGSSANNFDEDFAVARFNNNGSLDSTFDMDGKVSTSFGSTYDIGVSIALQDDGKIVLAGYSNDGGHYSLSDFAVIRYNSDGSLDSTFDSDGKLTTDFDSLYDGASSVVIQSDGKILVVGNGHNLSSTYSEVELVRYNSDGSLDDSFDLDGKVTTNFDSLGGGVASVAIQSDGKIVVVGSLSPGPNTLFDFAVIRYNSDGSLDESFDSDGLVTTAIGSSSSGAASVAIQEDGKIVVAGSSRNYFDNFTDFALARYNIGTVGVTENSAEENSLTILPNPFNNELFVKGTKENEVILIYNELGNEMMRQKTKDAETKINTERLLPGIYFLNYPAGTKSSTTKIVKF